MHEDTNSEKNPDKMRYCSNMRVPNQAIKRPTTEALTVEDVRMKLSGAAIFSVLDMNEAYHQFRRNLEILKYFAVHSRVFFLRK